MSHKMLRQFIVKMSVLSYLPTKINNITCCYYNKYNYIYIYIYLKVGKN